MSDERLRELERAFQRSGGEDDELALLRERLRTGVLSEYRLLLAAMLEYPLAEELNSQPLPSYHPHEFHRWLAEFAREGREPLVRLAVAWARGAVLTWAEAYPDDTRPQVTLSKVEECVLDPSDELAEDAESRWFTEEEDWGEIFGDTRRAAMAAFEAAKLLRAPADRLGLIASGVYGAAEESCEAEELEEAQEAEVVPWLLGHGDPLADQVKLRTKAGT